MRRQRSITYTQLLFGSVMLAHNAFAMQEFGVDADWVIQAPSLNENDICSAQKNINGIDVTIQSVLNGSSTDTILTISKLEHQMATGTIELELDNKPVKISSKNYKVDKEKISLLLTSEQVGLRDIGLTQTLFIGLKPHLSININAPNYPMYLLSECNSALGNERLQQGSYAVLQNRFPQQMAAQSQKREGDKPRSAGQKNVELHELPVSFVDFVEAFTITDENTLKFLSLAEAREKYTDWADAGWTGDEQFIMGIGTKVTKPAETFFDVWNKNRKENCESRGGKFLTVDAGKRKSGDFSGFVTYMLCENQKSWHYLTLIVVKDATPPSYGLIEARNVHESNLRALRNWIIDQRK
jgi:hypothetical protein